MGSASKEMLNKSQLWFDTFPILSFDTPRYARHFPRYGYAYSGRTENERSEVSRYGQMYRRREWETLTTNGT